MVTDIKNSVWAVVIALIAFPFSANASVNSVMKGASMVMSPLAAPDGTVHNSGDNTYLEVTLESAGSLGVEVMYLVEKLSDVKYLKVKGTLNSADWTSIKNMWNLKQLDLQEAVFSDIPANEFDGRTSLEWIYLPEGMKTIGNYAFRNTTLPVIDIPSSVTSIGAYAFYQAKSLTEVRFAENAVLKTIGERAFYQCTSLTTFLMPNSILALGNSAFSGCSSFSNLSLSTSLTSIPEYCFYNTTNLKNVIFPDKLTSVGQYAFANSGLENAILPVGLTSLGHRSFENCKSLTYLELPSYVSEFNYAFSSCTALAKVVCPACTPPTFSYDPFTSVTRSKITLQVPSFAVVDYKLDTYWLNFGTIEAMETDPTYMDVHGKLTLTNNRRPNGIPNVTINTNSSVIVGGNEPFEVDRLNFVIDWPNKLTGKLLSRSPMTVQSTGMSYYVKRNKWYFLSPFTDVPLSAITHSANASFVFRYYNSENRAANGVTNNNASWQNVTDSELKAGQGYIYQSNQDGCIQWSVEGNDAALAVNSANITTPLNDYASENAANANWNYVGNPYPCYYDAYYMDFTAPITVWDHDNNTYKAYSVVDDNYILHPMESFFVQKPSEVDAILFKEEGRQIETTTNRVSTARAKIAVDTSRRLYDIQLSDGINSDETRAIINEKASLDYEIGRDAAKFMSMESNVPQIFTIDDEGNNLAFNERPLADGKIRLGLYTGEAGAYTLKMTPSAENAQLYDAVTGKTICLSDEPYHFAIDNPGIYTDRFTLTLSAKDITAIGTAPTADASIVAVAGGVEVHPASATEIYVYGTDGRQVAYAKAVSGKTVINLPAGLYVVKVGNKAYKCIVD